HAPPPPYPTLFRSMLAPNRAAAQRRKADRAPGARARHAVASTLGMFLERYVAALCRCLTEKERRARWRIHLVTMMHLDNLDIPVSAEGGCRLPHKRCKQVQDRKSTR